MIAMQQYSRQHVVDVLHALQRPDLADEALKDLPDPVDVDRLVQWMMQHGLSRDEMVSRMGGSP
ncbi:MAG TPA: hypothetical protein VIY52_02455 [Streptosporangiaceae bacterium]